MEKVFSVIKCGDAQKVTLAAFVMEGEADHWWKMEVRTAGEGVEWTWKSFQEFFAKYFLDSEKEARASEFMMLEQGSMTVAQYEAKFTELSRFAPYLVHDEQVKTRKFEKGLRGPI